MKKFLFKSTKKHKFNINKNLIQPKLKKEESSFVLTLQIAGKTNFFKSDI